MDAKNNLDQKAREFIQTMYRNEYEKLVRCAISYLKTGNKDTYLRGRAEDVVQEMFMLVWLRREEVLSSKSPVGWLYNALHFKAKELLKEENKWTKRLLRYNQYYVKPVDPFILLELDGLVPKEDFNLLCKFHMEGYSYQELCRETGLTKSALGARMHRIRKKIRKQLKE